MEIAKSQAFVPHGSFQSLSRPAQHLACPPYPGYLPAARDVVLLSSSWLFQAVSSPHRHQAYLKDQGHRKGGSFLSSFCLFVNPCFGVPHSPTEEENKAGLVGVDDGFGESDRGDGGGLNLLLEELIDATG